MRKNILSVLQRNHRMNLFSALNRERLADELISAFNTNQKNIGNEPQKTSSSDDDKVRVTPEAFENNFQPNVSNLQVSESDRNRILAKTEQYSQLNDEDKESEVHSEEPGGFDKKNNRKTTKRKPRKNPIKKVTKKTIPNKLENKKNHVNVGKEIDGGWGKKYSGNDKKVSSKNHVTNKSEEFFETIKKKSPTKPPVKPPVRKTEKPKKKKPTNVNKPLKNKNIKKGRMPGDPLQK